MRPLITWIKNQISKFGIFQRNQEATLVGTIGLVLGGSHLAKIVYEPFKTASDAQSVFNCINGLSQLQVVGLVVCTALLCVAVVALGAVLARQVVGSDPD